MIGQEHQLQQLIANVAILHNDLQKQSEDALGLQQKGISQLRNQLAEIDKLLADALAKQLSDVSENLKQEIIEGGRQGLGDFSNHLEDLKRHMSHFAEFAVVTEQRLNRASRSLMLKNRLAFWNSFRCGAWRNGLAGSPLCFRYPPP